VNSARLLAYAQLLRLPNVFTAFADIALGASVAGALLSDVPVAFWGAMALIALASGCLYLAGMVWNDVFDRAEDAVARPFRPIPSGRVSVGSAVLLGIALLALGMGCAALAGLPGRTGWNHEPLAYAIGIAVAVLLYDGGLKRTPIGPVAILAAVTHEDFAVNTGLRQQIADGGLELADREPNITIGHHHQARTWKECVFAKSAAVSEIFGPFIGD
jgi:4-hydroxybenzoate polyprenyltransferase